MARCDSYVQGECTRGACDFTGWVQDSWGNAWEWVAAAQNAGFNTTMVPTVGAVVVYGQGGGYSNFGHCGVVTDTAGGDQFLVHEMNYVAWNQYDDRWSNMADVSGFILAPGTSASSGGSGQGRGGPNTSGDLAQALGTLAGDWNQTIYNEWAFYNWLKSVMEVT